MLRLGKLSGLLCIQFKTDDSFSTLSNRIKHRAEYLTRDNKTPTGIHRRLLAVCVEDAVDIGTACHWVIKTRNSGGNLDLDDPPQSGILSPQLTF